MIANKIKNLSTLKEILSDLKKKGKRIVFTNGCFDILHIGHIAYLQEAKRQGDILVVAVNSDDSAKRLKGIGRPIMSQEDRAKILASLEGIDFVTIFNDDTPLSIVKELNPDVIVKGGDWKEDKIIGGEYVKKMGGRVVTIPYLKDYSTTSIIEKIKNLK